MPYQNRVDPFGTLIASRARGTWMGTRGILHDDNKQITRTHPPELDHVLAFIQRAQALNHGGGRLH
jgi:hypothetical protein